MAINKAIVGGTFARTFQARIDTVPGIPCLQQYILPAIQSTYLIYDDKDLEYEYLERAQMIHVPTDDTGLCAYSYIPIMHHTNSKRNMGMTKRNKAWQ